MKYSFFDELRNRAIATPHVAAAITLDGDISYETVFALSQKIALGLQKAGVKAGDRVAAHIGNRYELISAYYALLGVGAVIVPVALKLSGGEINYLLRHSAVRYYIGDHAFYQNAHTVIEAFDLIEQAWVLDLPVSIGKAQPLHDLLVEGSARLEPLPSGSMAAILYSSGTTGAPKGIAYSHGTLQQSVELLGATLDKAAVQGSEQAVGICSVVDLVSAWSLLMNLTSVRRGRPLAISTVHSADLLFKLLRTGRVGWIGGAPSSFKILLDAVRDHGAAPPDLSQTNCVVGGDACPPALSIAFRETFGTPLQSSYGQTETGGPVIYHPNLSSESEPAIGWPLPGIEVKIDGDPGEIWIKSPAKPMGLWHGSGIAPFDDRWLYTGDLVRRRPTDDCIMFLSRIKDVMKIGGFTLAPLELEQAIAEHPAVAAAAVFSIPDDALGECPIAMIQLNPGHEITAQEIREHLTGRIADYKYPRDIVFLDRLPFAPSGKLARKKLADEYMGSKRA